jgi:hypothetical protein
MRSRRFGYSARVVVCLASLVAAASSCSPLDNEPEEQLESESSALQQPAVPTDQAATLVPGSKLDQSQLAAVLGGGIPEAVGDPCTGIGTSCGTPINAPLTPCGGFTGGVCDSTGTQTVIPINFICLPGQSGNVCTAVAGQNQQTVACTVPSNGRSCSTGCGNSFCLAFSSECDEVTNRVRNCFSNGVCSNDTCINQTATQQIVGTCTRDTEGRTCRPQGTCNPPSAGFCTPSAQCACLLGPL